MGLVAELHLKPRSLVRSRKKMEKQGKRGGRGQGLKD
jgi:hypothetical protein